MNSNRDVITTARSRGLSVDFDMIRLTIMSTVVDKEPTTRIMRGRVRLAFDRILGVHSCSLSSLKLNQGQSSLHLPSVWYKGSWFRFLSVPKKQLVQFVELSEQVLQPSSQAKHI